MLFEVILRDEKHGLLWTVQPETGSRALRILLFVPNTNSNHVSLYLVMMHTNKELPVSEADGFRSFWGKPEFRKP